ncbi:hypothetical protein niasHT_039061 [Heterodera trifolii]|uniref:EGF-like domain-containing protein n=1 Tax=Heterodera trifolii TaxID=157864 RepID=A0ABD2HTG4_9BILA
MMMKMMAFPSSFLQLIIFHLIIPLALLLFFFQTSSGANPCQDYSLHDCDAVAECDSEQPGFFQCKCPRGYVDQCDCYALLMIMIIIVSSPLIRITHFPPTKL